MHFSNEIIQWYNQHKRNLPWRDVTDPYIIWLSEIILQQTRVDQGLPYFRRFLNQYASIEEFAQASEADILLIWQGLGYYTRGRNMHKAARLIVEEYQGAFPKSYASLLQIPGIGSYTAAAIASFSFNEAVPVLDGNVFRVLSRYYGIDEPINTLKGRKIFQDIAAEALDINRPALHNQAIMEFGALLCTPKRPACASCPIRLGCYALKQNKVSQLPIKIKKTKSRDRYFNYFIIKEEAYIYMRKRGAKDIWENLYEFPMLETSEAMSEEALIENRDFRDAFGEHASLKLLYIHKKHILSHQNIYARFFELIPTLDNFNKKTQWDYVLLKDLDTLAKPKLIFTFIKDYINSKR